MNKPLIIPNNYSTNYDNLQRFISYYNQKDLIIKTAGLLKKKIKILEIGIGNGFLNAYLTRFGYKVKTFDINPKLKPDYLGDLKKIREIVKNKFDIVCCFEVLEHINFHEVENILEQLSDITKGYLIISLPQLRLYSSLWLKLPRIKPLSVYFNLPFPLKHRYDGKHCWELGAQGYSRPKFSKLINKYFTQYSQFTDPLDPYHIFFILQNK